jgi:hypothetical protein
MSKATLPTPESNAGKAEWSEVYANDAALRESVNSVANEQLAGGIEDSKLKSPLSETYRYLLSAQQTLVTDYGAGTYILGSSNMGGNPVRGSGTGENAGVSPPTFYFAKADYELSGKTQKLRLRAQIHANATKPALKFTFGLYPVTVAGGTDGIVWTFGTVVTGSQVEINEPAASTVTPGVTSDFAIPSDGAYMLGIVTSGTLTNNSLVLAAAQLQTRHV